MQVPKGQAIFRQMAPSPGGSMLLPSKLGQATFLQPKMAQGQPGSGRLDLTAAIPDPETIRKQKEVYAADLEQQLKKGVELLGQAHKEQADLLRAAANQEKHRYNLAMDQQVKQQELILSQQYNEQLMNLQQAAQQQRAELEQQACALTLEYQQRKVREEFMVQQAEIAKQHQDAQSRLASDMDKLGGPGTPGSSFSVPRPNGSYAAVPQIPAMVAACLPPGGVLPYVPPGIKPPSPTAAGGKPQGASFRSPTPSAPAPVASQLRSRRSISPAPARFAGVAARPMSR